ncbi:MAG TPA: PP2C family protein-serine/threonine phosphatase [Terracidiphilus sp.]|nr:PP2C family protein-serine/threonine phosphatase [Terracidiphilus sp.]HKF49347.1 PP2C family protein-serine/threonine phosphatase [Terracidiphilus sp.]
MDAPNAWQSTPLKSKIIFLLAVFFVFVGIEVANDVINMGRTPPMRFAVTAVLTGAFALLYAASGIRLQRKFWKAFPIIFVTQAVCMTLIANFLHEERWFTSLSAAGPGRLHSRLAFDGTAIIVCACLGYTGFIFTSINEGRRYIRIQTEKATLESEMAAAREIQRIMVPEALPPVRGYAIESVYRPAAEVGGDFFQVISLPSGRTLIVVGDVSGKGLRAAMIVSMLVGMVTAVTGFTEEPAEILAEINRRTFGRTHGGFATCIVVRLEDGGHLALANAGHPPLYLNGAELPFPGSLPLGLAESATYAHTTLEMRIGDRAVLLTDGIPEARNPQGALLGFPRVESLLHEGASAASVAAVAQQHGQNDDLTVISIAREA